MYIIENQEVFKEELKKYPFNSENMNKEYLELFNLLVADKSLNKIQINKIYQRLYLLRFKLSKFTRKFSQVNIRTRIKKILSIWK